MILAMGIAYGGMAQIIAGIFDWYRGNLFGTMAFLSYGFFWLSFVFTVVMPKIGMASAADEKAMGCYMFIWGMFSFTMFIASFKKAPWALVMLFGTVVILFMLLAAHFFTESAAILKAAGYEGVLCGLLAMYMASGELLNEIYGRTILPIGKRAAAPSGRH